MAQRYAGPSRANIVDRDGSPARAVVARRGDWRKARCAVTDPAVKHRVVIAWAAERTTVMLVATRARRPEVGIVTGSGAAGQISHWPVSGERGAPVAVFLRCRGSAGNRGGMP